MTRFPIGHTFQDRKGCRRTVVDHHTTTDSKGEVFKFRYVTEHQFAGHLVTDRDVCHTTVARLSV